MTTGTIRPRGRRPGRDDTRGMIARCALELFDRNGYDRTSLRAIARHAGVDPALVHHYFDSKAQLFTSVVFASDVPLAAKVADAATGDRSTVGTRMAKTLLTLVDDARFAPHVVDFVSTGSGTGRSRLLSEFLAREVFARLAAGFGHRNDILRGQLAAATLFGLLSARRVLELGVLSSASTRSLIEPLGRALQDYLVEDW